MRRHAHEYNVAKDVFADDPGEPRHRGLSDEEYAAEHWRRVELAVRR